MYISEELCCVADMPVGERSSPVVDLQSAGCPTVTPRYIVYTAGDRSFAKAACPRIWNGLPDDDVTSATSLLTFRRKLKAHLFRQSCPDLAVFS